MPKTTKPFSVTARIRSFKYAIRGFVWLIKLEHNARIHLLAALVAVVLGLYFGIASAEWIAVIFAIVLVLAAELINSSVEFLADSITTNQNPYIEKAKDLAAAAVLILAIGAAAIGLIIFIPYFALEFR